MLKRLLHRRARKELQRVGLLGLAVLLLVSSLKPYTSADQLGSRFIAIASSQPSVVTSHSFTFDITTAGNLGSIEFEYCINSPFAGAPCSAPAGLSVLAANLASQTGQSGFSIDPLTTANKLVLSRSPALANPGTLSYNFANITNPSTTNQSIYVRISTFASSDTSGSRTDTGAVVFDLSNGLGVGGFVPPWIVLCVGAVVAINCSNQVNDIRSLGNLSPKTTGYTTTQFSVGTNDPGGYNVYVLGDTLTSGNNTIPPLSSLSLSITGAGQFGINLVSNSSPPVGSNPGGIGTGIPTNGYDQPNHYKMQNGDLVATSPLSTDYNLFTVSYIANIDQSQPKGIYSTTMTYLGSAAF